MVVRNRLYSTLPPGYIIRSTVSVFFGSTGLFFSYEYWKDEENFQRRWLMPLVHRFFEPETAHKLGVEMAKFSILTNSKGNKRDYPELHCRLFGHQLDSPIGLAAGFDKNGEAIEGLRKSGFSFVEIGSITPKPQPGNKPPRLFRLVHDQAVINSYGFNSDGVGPVFTRVKKGDLSKSKYHEKITNNFVLIAFDPNSTIPLGINLGKNKTTEDAAHDYEIGINFLGPYCDYIVINVSSPNTTALRSLQSKEELKKLLSRLIDPLKRARANRDGKPYLLIKISPDLSHEELKDIGEICLDRTFGIDGLIITNTTTSRPESLKSAEANRTGGLSGAPLKNLSTQAIRTMYKVTNGKILIIGCGGIGSGKDAYEKIKAGASGVQLYTALVYQGFPVVGRIKRELAELLNRDGYKKVEEAIGAEHKKTLKE